MKGDNLVSLKKLPDNSIDSIVSDPPYGLSFMNKKWDYDVPSVEFWKEVYRVLKPGGHILSFGGTRTYHRMVVNIEDAGFEIRDQIQWLYGSGFPKSHNIGKAVDKLEGNEREVVEPTGRYAYEFKDNSGKLVNTRDADESDKKSIQLTKGNSPYEGWGTALKPANEPICVARKPLSEKSVAENVLKWGTGGINIDGCRIGIDPDDHIMKYEGYRNGEYKSEYENGTSYKHGTQVQINTEGRFLANIILDETAAELLDEQSGFSKTNHKGNRNDKGVVAGVNGFGRGTEVARQDSGGASRFFYVAKVSKKERNMGLDGFEEKNASKTLTPLNREEFIKQKNNHPTVKPVQLMTYLCRLITPPGGIVLDPYMGPGSTGIAALLEGFRFCGMEMDEDYFKIAEARINSYEEYRDLLKKK